MHSLLRLHGWAIARISKNSANCINKELNALYPSVKNFNAGLYFLRCEDNGAKLICKRIDMDSGGSHEILWTFLQNYLDELRNTVDHEEMQDNEGKDLIDSIDRFQRVLEKMGERFGLLRYEIE